MKEIIVIILVSISLVCAQLPAYNAYAITNKPLENEKIYKPIEKSREELYQDIFFSLLLPYIQKSVEDYYKKFLTDIPTVDSWDIDILSVERPNGYRTFLFVIEIQVNPYIGPHLGVGVDRLKITIHGAGNVEVNSFEHIRDYELPPHYQHIIKKNLKPNINQMLQNSNFIRSY